jgi:hypothetical protein
MVMLAFVGGSAADDRRGAQVCFHDLELAVRLCRQAIRQRGHAFAVACDHDDVVAALGEVLHVFRADSRRCARHYCSTFA